MKTAYFFIGILFFSFLSVNVNAQSIFRNYRFSKAAIVKQQKAKAVQQKLVKLAKAQKKKATTKQSSRIIRRPSFSKFRPTHRGTTTVVTAKKPVASVGCVNGCLDVVRSNGSGYNSSVAICIDLCTCLAENPGNIFKCVRQATDKLVKK